MQRVKNSNKPHIITKPVYGEPGHRPTRFAPPTGINHRDQWSQFRVGFPFKRLIWYLGSWDWFALWLFIPLGYSNGLLTLWGFWRHHAKKSHFSLFIMRKIQQRKWEPLIITESDRRNWKLRQFLGCLVYLLPDMKGFLKAPGEADTALVWWHRCRPNWACSHMSQAKGSAAFGWYQQW